MNRLLQMLLGVFGYVVFHTIVYSEPSLLILLVCTVWYDLEINDELDGWKLVSVLTPAMIIATVETML